MAQQQQLQQWREAFSCFADPHLPPGQGTINTRELGQLIRALGKNPSQDEMTNLLREVDPNGEGNIDFNAFCNVMARPFRQPETEAELLESFRAFDRDGSGTISTQEFRTVMRNFGEPLTDDEVDEILKAAEACEVQKGVLDYRRFAKVLGNR
ncbi:hypothetical protein GUITHDRAFT_86224 [Guillardia theta CCMP2712]|uniref:EF-hand domain-containing protein n=1 Tax=Guillardia theta (strain CCMP2712) TaxID=905079 RepID=L1JIB4_GUITC|nr:hypothetical protein GUITHDRAFT_86224 [Guillardia theta CCMP2712]EKX47820.1 hypothetical protein GUITHDRAFT_86224 [Guillardia theta CCMP2712]|eukprot:XP_005834800.1 hypothetical protein GUITHDRAFT_86224 [Guillardia theta CCMP2712]